MKQKLTSTLSLIRLSAILFIFSLTGCQTYHSHPTTQTDGSYVRLPNASDKAAVWGTRREGVQSLTTWLLKRGITLVDEVKLNQIANEIRESQPGTQISHAEVFKLGKAVGAKEIILIDTDVSTWRTNPFEVAFGQTPTVYTAGVFIRALDAESGEIHWSGKALSMDKFTNLTEGIHQLTCHALATAWGLRPPGTTVQPNICPPGKNIMVFTEPISQPANGMKSARTTRQSSPN